MGSRRLRLATFTSAANGGRSERGHFGPVGEWGSFCRDLKIRSKSHTRFALGEPGNARLNTFREVNLGRYLAVMVVRE